VEGGGFGGGGGETPIAIEAGKVDGVNMSFSAANVTYTGTVKGDVIELQRTGGFPGGRGGRVGNPPEPAGPRPAIGPPPDGTDPSRGVGGGRGLQTPGPMVLRRVKR
jgi:beta-galactosidase